MDAKFLISGINLKHTETAFSEHEVLKAPFFLSLEKF